MRFNHLFIAAVYVFSVGCATGDKAESSTPTDTIIVDQPVSANKQQLPFVGKRQFETRPGISGTGTPAHFVEIKEDGTVLFSYIQRVLTDESEIDGTYNAGSFKKIMKSSFAELDEGTRFFEITADKIYETDANGVHLTSDECCSDLEPNCPCESIYFDTIK